jgi:tRNA(Ile2) C34 agmatinyltransferase TiaS
MSRILIGLDDTDCPGARISTARLARMLGETFAKRARFLGAISHMLYRGVEATTNNKASCLILEDDGELDVEALLDEAAAFIERHAEPSSGPGLVVTREAGPEAVRFGIDASRRLVSRAEAKPCLASLPHRLFGVGNGVIGALAAVGLTENGWSGRWLEYRQIRGVDLRGFDRDVQVSALTRLGVFVVSLESDAEAPAPQDLIDTRRWLRPQLLAGQPVLPVRRVGPGLWEIASVKRAERGY